MYAELRSEPNAITNPGKRPPTEAMQGITMTPTQSLMQDQLQRKHDELQQLIVQNQEELRRVSEQLLMAGSSVLPPILNVPLNANQPTLLHLTNPNNLNCINNCDLPVNSIENVDNSPQSRNDEIISYMELTAPNDSRYHRPSEEYRVPATNSNNSFLGIAKYTSRTDLLSGMSQSQQSKNQIRSRHQQQQQNIENNVNGQTELPQLSSSTISDCINNCDLSVGQMYTVDVDNAQLQKKEITSYEQ